jgi:hypothetical protein
MEDIQGEWERVLPSSCESRVREQQHLRKVRLTSLHCGCRLSQEEAHFFLGEDSDDDDYRDMHLNHHEFIGNHQIKNLRNRKLDGIDEHLHQKPERNNFQYSNFQSNAESRQSGEMWEKQKSDMMTMMKAALILQMFIIL